MSNGLNLPQNYTEEVLKQLNSLLADYEIYYQNLRGFHWNIKGKDFFALHGKFEELYNSAAEMIDTIAERILTLGGTPFHTFSTFLKNAEIKEAENVCDSKSSIIITIENIKFLIAKQRNIVKLASTHFDDGTVTVLADFITNQEKILWMLSSYLDE